MTRLSTALLTIGPKSIAPWGDRAWKVTATAQLVEGSTPYWIVTPTKPARHLVLPEEIEVSSPHVDSVVDSILFLLASHFGEESVENNLAETHNIRVGEGGVRELARFFELSDHSRGFLAKQMSQQVRLGLTQLDDLSLMNDAVIERLSLFGFDVEVFGPKASSQV
jgi:hypothetical protein